MMNEFVSSVKKNSLVVLAAASICAVSMVPELGIKDITQRIGSSNFISDQLADSELLANKIRVKNIKKIKLYNINRAINREIRHAINPQEEGATEKETDYATILFWVVGLSAAAYYIFHDDGEE